MISDLVADKLGVRAISVGLAKVLESAEIGGLAEGDNLEEPVDDAENEGGAT